MSRLVVPLFALLALVLAGCTGGGAPSERPSAAEATDGGGAESPSAVPIPSLEGIPADLLVALVADAAERTGTPPGEITAVSGTPMEWSDGSLDCPEPGMGYTQAIVDGYQVVLDAAGTELDYHVGSGNTFVLCQDGRPAPAP